MLTLWNRVKEAWVHRTNVRHLQSAGLTDVGRARARNEDAILVLDTLQLYLVADGMGGHAKGDVASKLAVSCVSEVFSMGLVADWPLSKRLIQAVEESNRRIYAQSQLDRIHSKSTGLFGESTEKGMGSTIVALAIEGNEAAIAHVGDSRAYCYRQGQLHRLTVDHSVAESAAENGMDLSELAPKFQQILTRALGLEQDVSVALSIENLQPFDVILLCSDGLTHQLRDGEIQDILSTPQNIEQQCQALIDAANQSGGRDNISCVLYRHTALPD